MASAESAEAKELSLIGKVELRIALTDSDTKLESILNTYLPPLLLKLESGHVNVRNKATKHLTVLTRKIKLPVASLLKQYKENQNALVRHFDILYIQQGLDRLPISVRLDLLPLLLTGIQSNFHESARHTSSLFNMLLKLLHSLALPPRGSGEDIGLRQQLGLAENAEDVEFLALWIGKLMLFSPNPAQKRLPGLDAEECSFLQMYDKKDTWIPGTPAGMNLIETKVVAAKFLASGAFTDTERFLPALFAASDPNSRLSDIGDDILKRAIPATSFEDGEVLDTLIRTYLGTRGTNGSLPARPSLQTKILTLMCKSKHATTYTKENVQIINEGFMQGTEMDVVFSTVPVKGLESSKLRTQLFIYINWLARISDSSHVNVLAPALVVQLREYIESQGWPTIQIGPNGQSDQDLNLRSLAYESIGILARASSERLIMDENLDLLRWLFNSLAADSSGREVGLSIDQALSSALGAFGQQLDPAIENSLEGLLLYNMQRGVGDIEGADVKVVRSTRFTAVRFANRCLPFSNTKARWMNVLALDNTSGEHREMMDEGKKGLDPYWYKMLNPVRSGDTPEQASASSKYDFPLTVDLVGQFFGQNSIWDVNRSHGNPLPMASAYGPAVTFGQNTLIRESLSVSAPTVDSEWDRQLTALITNDEHARNEARDHFKAMSENHGSNSTLALLLQAAFNGIVTPTNTSAASCTSSLLRLCSLSPDAATEHLSRHIQLLTDSIASNDRSRREASAHIFGILGSHHACPPVDLRVMLKGFDALSKGWEGAIGSEYLHASGAILANAYYWSRRALRGSILTASEDENVKTFVEVVLKILQSSSDKSLLDAAIVSIFELSLSGIMSPDLAVSGYDASGTVESLAKKATKGNESAVRALGSFAMQCQEDFSDNAVLSQIVAGLLKLHEVKDPAIQFAVGEALSYAAAGWSSKALIGALDIDGKPPVLAPRNMTLSWILEKVFEDCKTSKPALRQASVIWLLCLVQYCGHLPPVREQLRNCQAAFKGFLADRDSLNQETASRGLSLVYGKGDRDLKDDLIRDLVGSFTGSSANMAGSVSGDTQLFEPGALPTGDGSITTYKDIMSLAAEVGNPSLVYKFMSLAANNAIWSSRAAFGRFGLSSIFSDASVDGYLAENPKLYPALFRYRFDPNSNVRSSMNDIWAALVHEPTVTIDQHFDSIMRDLLKNILGKEWRTRQACCAAIADLVQSRPAAKYEKYIGEIWTLTFKVCDDIKESVRTAAMALARVLVGILTRGLEAGDSSTRSASAMLKNVLPFLLSPSGLESPAEDVQSFSLSALLQIIKKSTKDILRPFVPDLVGRLILLLSSLEPEGIEYIRLRAEQYGVTGQQIDDARLSGIRGSPMLEAIERCLDFLDEASMHELQRPLENAITTGLGLPSRVGGSRVLVSLSTRHNFIFRPHADRFLKLARKQVLDRNETISVSYSAACGYLSRLASDREIIALIAHCRKLYFESDDERHRVVAGDIVLAISKHATDRFNALAAEILPFVFLAKHDSLERAKAVFEETWNETVGGSRTVLLYMKEIIELALQYLDSPRWSLKHTAAFAIAGAIKATGDDIGDSIAKAIWPGIQKAVDGKTWEGKEKILEAFVKFARARNAVTQDNDTWARIQKIILRESKRDNAAYRQHALGSLAEYVEIRDSIDLATEVYEITAPIIEGSLARSDEMDLDLQPGGHPSKTTSEETLANAQAALLRSINPYCQTNEGMCPCYKLSRASLICCTTAGICSSLSRALALTTRTLSENADRNVRNVIYEAERSLFEKLQKSYQHALSEPLIALLIEYLKLLFINQEQQVEQTRIKAAEAATAFAPLTGQDQRMRAALIDAISSAKTQERSVSVQQSLDRARRAIPDV
ncbi:MAG: hypothetical protein Q9220_002392 [cf. Caloplaca sp. 1 TL-2023]